MGICFAVILLVLVCIRSTAFAYEGRREQSVLLNGFWEFAPGEGDEHAGAPEGQAALDWQEVALPGQFMAWDLEVAKGTRFIWAKRTFEVSETRPEIPDWMQKVWDEYWLEPYSGE